MNKAERIEKLARHLYERNSIEDDDPPWETSKWRQDYRNEVSKQLLPFLASIGAVWEADWEDRPTKRGMYWVTHLTDGD